jgi:hypothetical protein
VFFTVLAKAPLWKSLIAAAATVVLLTIIRDVLYLGYPEGLLEEWISVPGWLV